MLNWAGPASANLLRPLEIMTVATQHHRTNFVTKRSGVLIRNVGDPVADGTNCEWRPRGVRLFGRGLKLSRNLAIELTVNSTRVVAWTSVPDVHNGEVPCIHWSISGCEGDVADPRNWIVAATRGPSPRPAIERLFDMLGMDLSSFKILHRLSLTSTVVQALIERGAMEEGCLPADWMPAIRNTLVEGRYLDPTDEELLSKLDTELRAQLAHLVKPDGSTGSPPRKLRWGERRPRGVRTTLLAGTVKDHSYLARVLTDLPYCATASCPSRSNGNSHCSSTVALSTMGIPKSSSGESLDVKFYVARACLFDLSIMKIMD